MHRSSESIASLAAALAKAQMMLTNPEKSLTATVGTDRYDEPGRTFRYAPLSSGLDIVRTILGQHEIATVQTTAIDQATQAVSLTTVLAHSSGEWIASDWPVCALSDMATPRRMGAALTYARRYALFTLVGIAGEEDLDAPDLAGPVGTAEMTTAPHNRSGLGKANGKDMALGTFAANRRRWSPPKQILQPEKSAALRDQLIAELAGLRSSEEATEWAQRALGAKNTLRGADAAVVEAAFTSRMAELTAVARQNSLSLHLQRPSTVIRPPRRRPRCRVVSLYGLQSGQVLNSAPQWKRRVRAKLPLRWLRALAKDGFADICPPRRRYRLGLTVSRPPLRWDQSG
jgi:hypothetical protein